MCIILSMVSAWDSNIKGKCKCDNRSFAVWIAVLTCRALSCLAMLIKMNYFLSPNSDTATCRSVGAILWFATTLHTWCLQKCNKYLTQVTQWSELDEHMCEFILVDKKYRMQVLCEKENMHLQMYTCMYVIPSPKSGSPGLHHGLTQSLVCYASSSCELYSSKCCIPLAIPTNSDSYGKYCRSGILVFHRDDLG